MRAEAEGTVEHCALSTISCEGQMSVLERYQSCISLLPTVSELLWMCWWSQGNLILWVRVLGVCHESIYRFNT